MAVAMSASAIHAQSTSDPGKTLQALYSSMRDELATTEMFISVFYGVVDRKSEQLRYANAGHPHAFVVPARGKIDRLAALNPPLGMSADAPAAESRAWNPDSDMLLLFTDGVSDARNADGDRLGEERVLELVQKHRADAPERIVDRIFRLIDQHTAGARRRDDLTVLALRS